MWLTLDTCAASALGSKRTVTDEPALASGSGTGGPQAGRSNRATKGAQTFTFTHRRARVFGFAQNAGAATFCEVSPEDLKQLRKELSCTAKELALTLGIEPKELAAWEAGELFPTKRYVGEMEAL